MDLAQISRGLAAAVDATGMQGFHRLLLEALSPALAWSYRYVFVYRRDGPPRIPFFEGIARAWIDNYLDGYYRFDPFYRLCLKQAPTGVHLLRDHMAAGGSGFRYDAFLVDIDVVDDVVLMLPGLAGETVALTWDRSGERFPAEAISFLRDIEPLVAALHRAHLDRVVLALAADPSVGASVGPWALFDRCGRLLAHDRSWPADDDILGHEALHGEASGPRALADGRVLHLRVLPEGHAPAPGGRLAVLQAAGGAPRPLSLDEAVAGFLPEALAPREREIVRLALHGYDNAAIARSLGISDQGVRNRKRGIYDKLDITSERELFRLFLDHVMGDLG